MEKGSDKILNGDEIDNSTVGFPKTVESLKNQLFIRKEVTNIGQTDSSGFNELAIFMK